MARWSRDVEQGHREHPRWSRRQQGKPGLMKSWSFATRAFPRILLRRFPPLAKGGSGGVVVAPPVTRPSRALCFWMSEAPAPPPLPPLRKGGKGFGGSRRRSIERNKNAAFKPVQPGRLTPAFHQPRRNLSRGPGAGAAGASGRKCPSPISSPKSLISSLSRIMCGIDEIGPTSADGVEARLITSGSSLGLMQLKGLAGLSALNVMDTQVSATGVNELQQARPSLKITP